VFQNHALIQAAQTVRASCTSYNTTKKEKRKGRDVEEGKTKERGKENTESVSSLGRNVV
jgi:hypothetical protein